MASSRPGLAIKRAVSLLRSVCRVHSGHRRKGRQIAAGLTTRFPGKTIIGAVVRRARRIQLTNRKPRKLELS
jgi:hypothetical protein